jgi:hypothetical protein
MPPARGCFAASALADTLPPCCFYRWMLRHHGLTHPLLATLARMYFFFGRHCSLVCRGGGPPYPSHVFLLLVCVVGIPPVILGLLVSLCIRVLAFLMAFLLNEIQAKDLISKKKNGYYGAPRPCSYSSTPARHLHNRH